MNNPGVFITLKRRISLFITLSIIVSFSACKKTNTEEALNTLPANFKSAKYVFFFVGDGMALPQINLAEAALANSSEASNMVGNLCFTKFPVAGHATTYAEDRFITGSAAAATALATGNKTSIGTVSKTADHSANYPTIAEMAKSRGMKVGIVTSVSIDHATPACFYAHEDSRGEYQKIAAQMATSGFDYFGGGFAKGNNKKYGDLDIPKLMKDAGYTLATTRSELAAAKGKVWAYNHTCDSDKALFYEIDRPEDHLSLAEFTQKGIELLDNENGFFMMVEGGKIDWACHANDAGSAAGDVIAFNKAVKKAVEFYNNHKDETLIIITGDHECGGLTLGYSATKYESAFDVLKNQKISNLNLSQKVSKWADSKNVSFNMALDSLKTYFGFNDASKNKALVLSKLETKQLKEAFRKSMKKEKFGSKEPEYVKYGPYDPFTVTTTHILNNKAGIAWTTFSHTGVPVPVFAMGHGQNIFSGYYDNTDIAKKIIMVAGLNK